MKKKSTSYDCVKAKRDAQARIYEAIRDRSRAEQVTFFQEEAASGELGTWWRRIRTQKSAPSSPEKA